MKWLAFALGVGIAALSGVATAQTVVFKPGNTRAVTSGTTDTATSKDYLGTIVWRSAAAGQKHQIFPACTQFNNGAWIQVVDGAATAGTDSITVTAQAGTVSGPDSPVSIIVNRGGFVLTCDGAAAAWIVTATSSTMFGGSGPVFSLVSRNGGGHMARNGSGLVKRN